MPREAIHARGRRDYYSFAGAVAAMKEGVMSSATRTLTYLHGDHLGFVSLTNNASGQKVSEQPFGKLVCLGFPRKSGYRDRIAKSVTMGFP